MNFYPLIESRECASGASILYVTLYESLIRNSKVLNIKLVLFWAVKSLLRKLLVSILLVSFAFPIVISPGATSFAVNVLQTATTITFSSNYVVTAVPKGSADCGHFRYYLFNASAGPISGSITSNDTQLNFEIASISDFNTWALQPGGSYVGKDCNGPLNAIVRHDAVTSFDFSANLPSNGGYALTFINTPGDEAAYVTITMNYPAAYTPQAQTSAGNPLTSIPGFYLESVLIGFILGLAILIVKRSKTVRRVRTIARSQIV